MVRTFIYHIIWNAINLIVHKLIIVTGVRGFFHFFSLWKESLTFFLLQAFTNMLLTIRGMTVTSGSVILEKNDSNLIGISIGGGAKYCPCLYVVQVGLYNSFYYLKSLILLTIFRPFTTQSYFRLWMCDN